MSEVATGSTDACNLGAAFASTGAASVTPAKSSGSAASDDETIKEVVATAAALPLPPPLGSGPPAADEFAAGADDPPPGAGDPRPLASRTINDCRSRLFKRWSPLRS